MNIINRIAGIIFFIVLLNLLLAEISNIQYEGTWARSHTYDWGFDFKGNDLFIGDNVRVEKYQILENGDLEFIDRFEDCNGLIEDIHVAGDSLYILSGTQPYSNFSVVDISTEEFVLRETFEELPPARLDGSFFSNQRYVFYIPFYNVHTCYYYDRINHSFNEWEIERFSHQEISGSLFIDIDWDYEAEGGRIRFQDISDVNNPLQVYLSEPIYHTLSTTVTAINDTTLVIIDGSNDVPIPSMKFWNISDPANPIELSSIALECDDNFYKPVEPTLLANNHLYITTASSTGNRYIYNINNLEEPILTSSWQLDNEIGYYKAYKSISNGEYFYTKRANAGIAKYNINQQPVSEPEDYYGEQFQSWIQCSYDGERVIIYKDDKIITKENPDDEGEIIYENPELFNSNGSFLNNDSLVVVKVIDFTTGTMELNLVETSTSELMNNYENVQYSPQQFYIEPYFYYCYQNNIKVYEVEDWNLNLIATLQPGSYAQPSLSVSEFLNNQIWVNSSNKVFIYNTDDFSLSHEYNNSEFVPAGDRPTLRFTDDSGCFCIQYNYSEKAKIFFMEQTGEIELIQALSFNETTSLTKIEDDLVSAKTSRPSEFYHYTEDGISEPYDDYNFKNVSFVFHGDEDHNRIFAWKTRSYESFTYDYFVDVDENEVTQPGCSLKNFPNPFNPNTVISFQTSDLSAQNMDESVSIEIYNVKGQKVKSFKELQGKKAVVWHGDDESGKAVGSGVYFYQLQSGEEVLASRKMTLMK